MLMCVCQKSNEMNICTSGLRKKKFVGGKSAGIYLKHGNILRDKTRKHTRVGL